MTAGPWNGFSAAAAGFSEDHVLRKPASNQNEMRPSQG